MKIPFYDLAILFVIAAIPPLTTATAAAQTSQPESQISGTQVIVRPMAARDNAAPANEYDKPAEGKKFVAIQIAIDNRKGKEEFYVTPSDLKLKDDEGSEYEVTFSDTAQPALRSGTLDGGDIVKGWVTFEVDAAVKGKMLRLRYESFDNKTAWIPLSVFFK